MTVKTFDEKKLNKLLKECDPYLLKYIEALKRCSAGWEDTAKLAVKKLRETSSNKKYTKSE